MSERSLGRAWIAALEALAEEGEEGECQWQDRVERCIHARAAVIVVEDPLSEPRFHWGGLLTVGMIYEYRREVLDGARSERLAGWGYSYHQRLFDHPRMGDQVARMVERLRRAPFTRRAVAVTWDMEDHASESPPCIVYLWAHVAGGSLDLHCHMRSNDWMKAALYDMDVMIELQSRLAAELGVDVGRYVHIVDHLHVYCRDRAAMEAALRRRGAFLTSTEAERLYLRDTLFPAGGK